MVNFLRLFGVKSFAPGFIGELENIVNAKNLIGVGKKNGLKVYKGLIHGKKTFVTVDSNGYAVKLVQKKPKTNTGVFSFSEGRPRTSWYDLESNGTIYRNGDTTEIIRKYRNGYGSEMYVTPTFGDVIVQYPNKSSFRISKAANPEVYVSLSSEPMHRLDQYVPEDLVEYSFLNKEGKYTSPKTEGLNFDYNESIHSAVDLFNRFRKH